jgi:type III pantothenate kinase
MILCLDAGNSRLKFGLFDGGHWLLQDALDYAAFDELPARLPATPQRIVACNVAGDAVEQRIEALAGTLGLAVDWLRSSAAACGVTSSYDKPQQLGADRWAALIAARSIYPEPAVVVMAGTATTIDAIDGSGLFRGGLILPGLSLMRSSLAGNTAGLPHASGNFRSLPTNTDDAIVSGAIHATLGAIGRMRAALGGAPLCLLSGGAADELTLRMDFQHRLVRHLVLEGLVRYSRTA